MYLYLLLFYHHNFQYTFYTFFKNKTGFRFGIFSFWYTNWKNSQIWYSKVYNYVFKTKNSAYTSKILNLEYVFFKNSPHQIKCHKIHLWFLGKKTMKHLVNTLLGKEHKSFMFGHKDHKVNIIIYIKLELCQWLFQFIFSLQNKREDPLYKHTFLRAKNNIKIRLRWHFLII